MFDGGEDKYSLADVLPVMQEVFRWAETEVPIFTLLIRDTANCAALIGVPDQPHVPRQFRHRKVLARHNN
jgi:hypothetical protein